MLTVLKLNIQKTRIMASCPINLWQIDGETVETVVDFIFLGSKITADGDCSHEIKRHLLLGRKAMTKLDSILKAETLLCQQRSIYSRLLFFQWSCMDVRVGLWRKLSAEEFWTVCWRRLWRVPWTVRRSNQSILKQISPGCSLEGLMLKLKLQYFGHLMQRVDSLEKTPILGGTGGRRRGDDRGWDGWMASLTQWTWVWASSGSWWWTGRPSVLHSMGLERVRHDWVSELNWNI